MMGNYYTGWFSDVPHLIATADNEQKLISHLYQMRELFEQCVFEAELDEILYDLKICQIN